MAKGTEERVKDAVDVELARSTRGLLIIGIPLILALLGWGITLEVRVRGDVVQSTEVSQLRSQCATHTHPDLERRSREIREEQKRLEAQNVKDRETLGRIDERVISIKGDLDEIRHILLSPPAHP
jgi:hypothetical protein